jgi:hypothetical protein
LLRGGQPQQQKLPVTPHLANDSSGQFPFNFRSIIDEIAFPDGYAQDAPSSHFFLQSPSYGLYFWKFRHNFLNRSRYHIPCDTPLVSFLQAALILQVAPILQYSANFHVSHAAALPEIFLLPSPK